MVLLIVNPMVLLLNEVGGSLKGFVFCLHMGLLQMHRGVNTDVMHVIVYNTV